eukprot:EG_transcript_13930
MWSVEARAVKAVADFFGVLTFAMERKMGRAIARLQRYWRDYRAYGLPHFSAPPAAREEGTVPLSVPRDVLAPPVVVPFPATQPPEAIGHAGPTPPSAASGASTGRRCGKMSVKGQCLNEALVGTRYCHRHLCPLCMQEKDSAETACPKHLNSARPDAVVPEPVTPPPGPQPCAHQSTRGHCPQRPVAGSLYCTAHSCPACGADKASDLPACVRHAPVPPTQAPVAPVPPSGGSPGGRCKHASPTHGACNGPAVPGSLYCRVHSCPKCQGDKVSAAPACDRCAAPPALDPRRASSQPMPPHACDHQWSNKVSVGKTCEVCRKRLLGVDSMACSKCGMKIHKRCQPPPLPPPLGRPAHPR